MNRQPTIVVGVLIVLLLAFGLRVWRIDGPYEHYDEKIAVWMSQRLETTPGWDTNWKTAEVPGFSDVDQYNFSAYIYGTHLFRRAIEPMVPPIRSTTRNGLISHRIFSVLCGTVAVGFVMMAAQRLGGGMLALLAGVLAALNPQLIQDAHYARPEAFMTLLTAIIVWIGCQRPVSERAFSTMAFLAGMLTATKAGNGLLLALPVVAAWQRWREFQLSMRCLWRPLALIGVAFALGWALGVPYALVHWEKYLEGLRSLSGQYAGSHPPHSLPNHHAVWPLLAAYFVATHGWPLLLAVGAGAVSVLRRKAWTEVGLLVLPLVGFAWLFGSQRVFFERNLSMIIPGALILAGMGFRGLLSPLLAAGPKRSLGLLLAVLLASMTGDRVVNLLLRDGLTAREPARHEAFLGGMRTFHAGKRNAFSSFFDEKDLTWLQTEVELGGGELLLFVWDFNDAYKARWLPVAAERFQLVPVGEYHGPFASYPTSTLAVTHGAKVRAYIVRSRSS